jgi:hypothetical protein
VSTFETIEQTGAYSLDWEERVYKLTVSAAGTYYIGFHNNSVGVDAPGSPGQVHIRLTNISVAKPGDDEIIPDEDPLAPGVVLFQTFDKMPTGNISDIPAFRGWKSIRTEAGGTSTNQWRVDTLSAIKRADGGAYARVNNPNGSPNDVWLISPKMELEANKDYNVSFWMRRDRAHSFENLAVYVGRGDEIADMTQKIWETVDINTSGWVQVRAHFKVDAKADYHLGLYTKSKVQMNMAGGASDRVPAHAAGAINLDDITVYEAPEFDWVIEPLPFYSKQIPEGQSPAIAKLTNIGYGTLTDVKISATWDGTTVNAVGAPLATLASGASIWVRFNLPKGNSNLTNINATADEIATPLGMAGSFPINVNTTIYAQDNRDVIASGFSILQEYTAGVLYEITEAQQLSAVAVGLGNNANNGLTIQVFRLDENGQIVTHVVEDGGMFDTLPLFVHEQVIKDTLLGPQWHVLNLDTLVNLESGTYFLAITNGVIEFNGDTNSYFYLRHNATNSMIPLNAQAASNFVQYNAAQGSLALRMVMYEEIDHCDGATNLKANATLSSVTFEWTAPPSAMSQELHFNDGTTIHTSAHGGTVNSYSLRDVLKPGGTNYKFRMVAVCNALLSDTTDWVTFDALTCQSQDKVTLTYAAGTRHQRDFSGEDMYCWDQVVNPAVEVRWVRVNNAQRFGGGFAPENMATTRLVAGFASTSRGSNSPMVDNSGNANAYVNNEYAKGAATKLISPVFDLSDLTKNPVQLSITHHNPRHSQAISDTGRHDTLAIYYRLAEASPWVFLQASTSAGVSTTWARMNITLPEVGATMQFAFEAKVRSDARGTGGGVFIDQFVIDTLPSTVSVVSYAPANNGTYDLNAWTSVIRATFNQPVSIGNQTAFDNIALTTDGGVAPPQVQAVINGAQLNITPAVALWDETTYTVTIPGGAISGVDQEITWSFTTNRLFPTATTFEPLPVVSVDNNVDPRATNVAIRVTFRGNVVTATEANLAKVEIWKVDSASKAPISKLEGVSATLTDKILTIHHPGLEMRSMYNVVIPHGVIDNFQDVNGVRPAYRQAVEGTEPMVNFGPWYIYTTNIRADLSVESRLPIAGAEDAELNTTVKVTFNHPISVVGPAALADVTIRKTGGAVVTGTVATIEGASIVIAHDGFEHGTEYTVTIPARLVGNMQAITWNFKTKTDGTSINPEWLAETTMVIYPNPATDVVYIKSEETISRMEIFNLQGQLVKLVNADLRKINVSDLPVGAYILRLTTDKGVVTHPIIKQ